MFKKLLFLLSFEFTLFHYANAQNSVADMTGKVPINSPNAAAFTQYGKIPVSLFTGIADIKVPLYEIKVDNFILPVYLSYYARGIQPNSHSGWVGTGWNLFAGAAITRKVNGAPDEWVVPYNFGPYIQGTQIGWLTNYNYLDNPNWNTPDSMIMYTGGIGINGVAVRDAAPDEFDFNINGFSGAFFLGEDGKWKVRAKDGVNIKIDVTTGSYTFTAQPHVSGASPTNVNPTFTQFILTAGDGTQYFFGGDANSVEFNRTGVRYAPLNTNTLAMAWHIKQIILPSGKKIDFEYFRDGIQYVYNPNTRAGFYQLFSGPTPSFFSAFNNNSVSLSSPNYVFDDVNVNVTDPVYLQTINYPEGKVVFNSTPSSEVDVLDSAFTGFCANNGNCSSQPGSPFFFQVISTAASEVIPQGFSGPRPPSKWYQLNDIELDDFNGNKIKDIKLTYTQDANTRLFLASVQATGYYNNNAGVALPPYTFTYNSTALPKYCTRQTDHWGFYNGPTIVNAFPLVTVDADGFPDNTYQTKYTTYREPNFTYTQAGILTQIKYPEGGNTQFQYEPNQYLKWVGSFPPSVTTLSQAAIGGGLRIKKIISQTDSLHTGTTYEYSYVNDSSGVCSGVLGMPRPSYFEEGSLNVKESPSGVFFPVATYTNITYKNWNSTSVFPSQNDDGNIVTYSSVIEKQTGSNTNNGKKVVTFSNHDNGYLNNPPDAAVWMAASDIQLYHYNDRSFERGNILSEFFYDSSNNPVKKIQYVYNNDPNRFNSFVKCILSDSRVIDLTYTIPQAFSGVYYANPSTNISMNSVLNFYRTSAIRMYTFYPFLQQKIETDYPSDHSSNPIAVTTNYTYEVSDSARNLVKEIVNDSKGQLMITKNQFPADFTNVTSSDAISRGIKNLQNKNATGRLVENYIQVANADTSNLRTISASLNTFDTTFTFLRSVYREDIIGPKTSFTAASTSGAGLSKDANYQPKFYVDNLDSVGNVLQQHKTGDINESFQWAYNSEHPVVKILNAVNTLHTFYTYTPVTQDAFFSFPSLDFNEQDQAFSVFSTGTITISINFSGNPGTHDTANISYDLVGPVSETGQLCTKGCTSHVGSVSFTNMPPGGYTIRIIPNLNNSATSLRIDCTYPGVNQQLDSSGIKEFFYNGFEEDSSGTSGNAHTGIRYFNGNYTVPFIAPNNKTYIIQWFNYNGSWNFNQQTYTTHLVLHGQIDDIRVFPSDAEITTYTYAPVVGMTSQIDHSGKTLYYEYDALSRLKNIKDYQGNIIKNFQYNYTVSCGNNCFVLPMQTFNGTNTISYPVGVFNVNGKLLGNAANQSQYTTIWNTDTADQHRGTLAAGIDSMHFNLTINTNATAPSSLTGCRYYQYDLAYNKIDAITKYNGIYVDFGDGTDSSLKNTGYIHTYPNSNLKTITIYHTESEFTPTITNYTYPPTCLTLLTNLRGNIPQYATGLLFISLQQPSAFSVSNINNWNSVSTVTAITAGMEGLDSGGQYECKNLSFPQDFMQNNRNLTSIQFASDIYTLGLLDSTFKISQLKSDWNSYFTHLQYLYIRDDQWNREDLTALTSLYVFELYAKTLHCSNDTTNNPIIPIPSSVIDSVLNQIAAGAGQNNNSGSIIIKSGGTLRTSASDIAVSALLSKGWAISIQ